MNTVLFVKATIGFSKDLFLIVYGRHNLTVIIIIFYYNNYAFGFVLAISWFYRIHFENTADVETFSKNLRTSTPKYLITCVFYKVFVHEVNFSYLSSEAETHKKRGFCYFYLFLFLLHLSLNRKQHV